VIRAVFGSAAPLREIFILKNFKQKNGLEINRIILNRYSQFNRKTSNPLLHYERIYAF